MKNKVIQKFFTILLGLMMVSPGWAQYCDFATGHLGNADFGDPAGRILLSIEPTTNANEFKLTIKPNYGNGATKQLDYLYVISSGASPYPATVGTDKDGDGFDEMSVTFSYASLPATASYTIQWSNPSWGGRWQLDLSNVDLSKLTSCGGGSSDLTDPKLTITTPATDPYELALGSTLTVAYTSANEATATITSSSDAVTVEGNVLTAAKTGIATITVEQAATDTYAAAKKTFKIKVPGDKSGNTACSGWNDDMWADQGGYNYDFSTTATDVILKITAIGEFPVGMAPSPEMLFLRRDGGDGIEGGGVVSGKTITWTFSKTSVLSRDGNPYLFNDNTIHFQPRIARANGIDQTNVIIYTVGDDCTSGGEGGDTPEPSDNLFNPANASIDTYFANWEWQEEKSSTANYDATTGKITVNIATDKVAQWYAQVKLNTGLTTLDVSKKIYFTCKMKSNQAFNGTTIKMFDNVEIYYENQSVSLTANKESTIILSGKNAVASCDGIIVFDFGWAPANTTIEIYDIEIGYGEIEDDSKPSAAPTAPIYPAEQVKAIYSATYSADCSFGYWDSETAFLQDTYGKRFTTTSKGYFGLEFSAKNCSNMEALHLDVWFPEAGSFRIIPVWKNEQQQTVDNKGVTITISAAEAKAWKSVNIPLDEGELAQVTDWSNVFQLKIENVPNKTFWLNNIYFYTTQEQEPEVITETTWWDEIRMVTINNVDYAVLCSVTRHENKTITFHIETTGWIDGLVPQVFINGAARTLNGYTAVNWKADYTTIPTDGTFETDDVLTCHLYFAYAAGGVANLPDFSYTVGAENDKPAIAVTGVVIDQTAPAMAIGDKLQLTATVNPVFVDNKNVTWSTTNASAVTVTDGGLIEAVGAGEATIRATSVADNTKYGELVITVQAVLESASYYGTGFFQSQLDQSYVAYNYNFTRAANHEVTLTVVFERDVTSYIEAGNFQFFENGQMHQMTYTAATKTATYSFGNKADGSEIVNFYFYFVLTGGGVAQTEAFTYTVGSTNEQPNKLIALNEVVANTLTDDETVDAIIARTFEAGNLYTLALPFDMTADQVAETFGTCTMYKLEDSYWKVEGENMYIRFAPVTEFKANTPILFTPATDLDNIVAKEVTINNAACATATTLVTFHGTYSKMNLTAPYYILADDQYLYPVVNDDYYINGMRGYFSFGSGSKAPKMARIILHEEITTDNAFLRNEKQEMRAKKVLENGRFVIIRDGARYGVLGVEE